MIDMPVELKLENMEIFSPLSYQEYFNCNSSISKTIFEPVISTIPVEIQCKLNSLSSVKNNWDALGAVKPSKKVIENSFAFLNLLPQEYLYHINIDAISITPYGTTVIDWDGANSSISVEIGIDEIAYFGRTNQNVEIESEGEIFNPNSIPGKLEVLFSGFSS